MEQQARVILWAVPRSVSTAFEFAMQQTENSLVFHEEYCIAYCYGEGRSATSPPVPKKFITRGYSYGDVQRKLEKAYSDFRLVFAKDMAFCASHKLEYLPKDYRHTFIIRDPRKSIPSYYKKLIELGRIRYPEEFNFHRCGFEALEKTVDHVTNVLLQNPLIIDADDLLNNPEGVLKEYCRLTGITFTAKMLNYQATMDNWSETSQLPGEFEFFDKAYFSHSFTPSNLQAEFTKEPKHIQELIQKSLPFYKRLYACRLII